MVDWDAAQALEARAWEQGIANSPREVLVELADAAHFDEFLTRAGVHYRRAVDVGVGPLGLGWVAPFGQGGVADLVGLEPLPRIPPATMNSALDAYLERLQGRITYVQSRAEDRALPAGAFDLVVCDNVVDHTENPIAVLEECRRLVTEDGWLAFGVNTFSAVGHVKWKRYTKVRHAGTSNVLMHPHSFTREDAEGLLAGSGWRVVAREPSNLPARLVGRAARHRLLAKPD